MKIWKFPQYISHLSLQFILIWNKIFILRKSESVGLPSDAMRWHIFVIAGQINNYKIYFTYACWLYVCIIAALSQSHIESKSQSHSDFKVTVWNFVLANFSHNPCRPWGSSPNYSRWVDFTQRLCGIDIDSIFWNRWNMLFDLDKSWCVYRSDDLKRITSYIFLFIKQCSRHSNPP